MHISSVIFKSISRLVTFAGSVRKEELLSKRYNLYSERSLVISDHLSSLEKLVITHLFPLVYAYV